MFPRRIAFCSIFLAALTSWPAFAQDPEQSSAEPSAPSQFLLSEQLNELVAPIALYPDPLLSQILAASTYPLEIVEAQQWLQQTRLPSQQLIEAAKQQNWDPSVQALVAFPSVLTLLNRNIRWT